MSVRINAEIKVMHLQAKETPEMASKPTGTGREPGTDSLSQPSKGTTPGSLTYSLQK